MILSYLLRIICLSCAVFFLWHVALSLIVRLMATPAIRWATRRKPAFAARFLFAVRLAPAVLSGLIVLGLCLPIYLWTEPEGMMEHVSPTFVALAALGASIWIISLWRTLSAAVRSVVFSRQCEQAGRAVRFPGDENPVLIIDDQSPILALVDVFRPRIVISRSILNELSEEQLDAALAHERAHGVSKENLKRLLLLITPDVLPCFPFLRLLDREWIRMAEWAADDEAIGHDRQRSLPLASALVRVARMGMLTRAMPLATSLLSPGDLLSERVDRLMSTVPVNDNSSFRLQIAGSSLLVTFLFAGIAAATVQPGFLSAIHDLMEHLIR